MFLTSFTLSLIFVCQKCLVKINLERLSESNTKVYADIRGFPGEGALNDSGVGLIENVDFQGFRRQRRRHLRI